MTHFWESDKDLIRKTLLNDSASDLARELALRLEAIYDELEPALLATDSLDARDLTAFVMAHV